MNKRELVLAIAETLHQESANNLEGVCAHYGITPFNEDIHPMQSKRKYVENCLLHCDQDKVLKVAELVSNDYGDKHIKPILYPNKPSGSVENIIFAASKAKPDIIFSTLTNGKMIRSPKDALIYDEPIDEKRGLVWKDLLSWWLNKYPSADEEDLYDTLYDSLQSDQEKLFFQTYYDEFESVYGDELPVLIPQVYLYFDPKTNKQNGGKRVQQRIDFLMLLPGFNRMVFEIDGIQHYSNEKNNEFHASRMEYATTMSETRQLQLDGFQVYRFGTYDIYKGKGRKITREFFQQLFKVLKGV